MIFSFNCYDYRISMLNVIFVTGYIQDKWFLKVFEHFEAIQPK
jgi:hypothetical protein